MLARAPISARCTPLDLLAVSCALLDASLLLSSVNLGLFIGSGEGFDWENCSCLLLELSCRSVRCKWLMYLPDAFDFVSQTDPPIIRPLLCNSKIDFLICISFSRLFICSFPSFFLFLSVGFPSFPRPLTYPPPPSPTSPSPSIISRDFSLLFSLHSFHHFPPIHTAHSEPIRPPFRYTFYILLFFFLPSKDLNLNE